jgi:hypothetical protein
MRQSDAEKRSGAHLRRFPWSSMSVFDVSMDETSICVVDSRAILALDAGHDGFDAGRVKIRDGGIAGVHESGRVAA